MARKWAEEPLEEKEEEEEDIMYVYWYNFLQIF
jgi:hypothetical protein